MNLNISVDSILWSHGSIGEKIYIRKSFAGKEIGKIKAYNERKHR